VSEALWLLGAIVLVILALPFIGAFMIWWVDKSFYWYEKYLVRSMSGDHFDLKPAETRTVRARIVKVEAPPFRYVREEDE
jgi:hypothetical protein